MSNGSRVSAYAIAEATYGTTPATPSMARLRMTGIDLGTDKDTLSSKELRSDRQVTDFRMGQNKVGGTISAELVDDALLDALLEATLCGTWTADVLKNGTTRRSFSILEYFEDLGAGNKPYHLFTGVEFASLEVKLQPNGLATIDFDTIGKTATRSETAPTGATLAEASTTSAMDSFTGSLTEGGSGNIIVTEVSFKVDNGMDRQFVIGSRDTIRPSIGMSNVSGSLTAHFDSAALLDKFLDETLSSLAVAITDNAGVPNTRTFTFPSIRYTGGRVPVKDDGPLIVTLPWQAVYNDSLGAAMSVART
jgi:hypothetical protein